MAFVVDREKLRTFDPDRGYELFKDGGGSDGTQSFKLVGKEGVYYFAARSLYEEDLPPEELTRIAQHDSRSPFVWCIYNWNDHWRPIIREAMMAYKAVAGLELPNYAFFVQFGTKESAVNAFVFQNPPLGE